MKQQRRIVSAVFWALAFAALILDSKTAAAGAEEAVTLCIRVLLPTLFPFFVVSCMLTGLLGGTQTRLLRPLTRLLRLHDSAQPMLLLGCVGGYPIGAVCIAQGRKNGLSRGDAQRMMAFCSNAGPAFIFGMGSRIFSDTRLCLLTWAIHLLSAVIVGLLTAGRCTSRCLVHGTAPTLSQALRRAMRILCDVCGWVILFRVLIAFLRKHLLYALRVPLQIVLSGALELANGASALHLLSCDGARLTVFCAMLSFGGLCVYMQTRSAAEHVDLGLYLPGKLTQCALSILLSCPAQFVISRDARSFPPVTVLLLCGIVCVLYPIFVRISEKNSSKSAPCVV